MAPRFYCSRPITLTPRFQLPPELAHHAVQVLRLRVGDPLVLFDGTGGEYTAVMESTGREVSVAVTAFADTERESPLNVTLYQALPAGDKMDWVVQKAVELGVRAVVPVSAERSVVKLSGERAAKRLAHWRQVAVSACEQCGRNRVPQLADIVPFGAALASCGAAQRLMLVPGGALRVRDLPVPLGDVALMVGPEGGLSPAELAALRSAGFTALGLGPRVLRTETAGLAALAALAACWGDV
jgi:16S rRNA (uracil1498-N3)-methyltransferase